MNGIALVFYAIVAGLAVVATTAIAAKSNRALAGILAAAPITPTASVLVLGSTAPARVLLHGVPIVAATALAILVSTWLRRRDARGSVWISLAIILPLALLLNSGVPVALLVATTVAAALLAQETPRRHMKPNPSTRRSLPVLVRFLLGAASVAMVAIVQYWAPALTPFVAVMPLLFVASVLGAQWHAGRERALAVLRGGIAGTLGVTAFILVFTLASANLSPLWALPLAWCAYGFTAILWTLALGEKKESMGSTRQAMPRFHV